METIAFFVDLYQPPWLLVNSIAQVAFIAVGLRVSVKYGKTGIALAFLSFAALLSALYLVDYEPDVARSLWFRAREAAGLACTYCVTLLASGIPLLLARVWSWSTWISATVATLGGCVGVLYFPMLSAVLHCVLTGDCL